MWGIQRQADKEKSRKRKRKRESPRHISLNHPCHSATHLLPLHLLFFLGCHASTGHTSAQSSLNIQILNNKNLFCPYVTKTWIEWVRGKNLKGSIQKPKGLNTLGQRSLNEWLLNMRDAKHSTYSVTFPAPFPSWVYPLPSDQFWPSRLTSHWLIDIFSNSYTPETSTCVGLNLLPPNWQP